MFIFPHETPVISLVLFIKTPSVLVPCVMAKHVRVEKKNIPEFKLSASKNEK